MHLTGMEKALRTVLTGVRHDDLTTDEVINLLVQSEWDYRENKKIERALKGANFRYQSYLENIDYSPSRGLDKNLVMRLATCSYVEQSENIVITGQTGVGKSYLATALGRQACLTGYKVLYKNAQKLFAQLRIASLNGTYLKELEKIAKKDIFIIDDFALETIDHQMGLMLLEILEDRGEKKPVIFTSQLPLEKWYDVISEKTIADAIMDRIVNTSHKIALKGESLRKRK